MNRSLVSLANYLTWRSSGNAGDVLIKNTSTVRQTHTRAKRTVDSHSVPAVRHNAACVWGLFLQVVTGVETGRLWYCFRDAPGRRPIWGEVQRGAMRSGPDNSPTRRLSSYCLYLGLLHVVPNLENSGHSGLHPASLVNTGLSLQIASGLEFQAFVRALRDTGTAAEGLFKTSSKPVLEK